MATKTFCDRCGEEINPKIVSTFIGMRRTQWGLNDYDYELCVSCARELKLWLNESNQEKHII